MRVNEHTKQASVFVVRVRRTIECIVRTRTAVVHALSVCSGTAGEIVSRASSLSIALDQALLCSNIRRVSWVSRAVG